DVTRLWSLEIERDGALVAVDGREVASESAQRIFRPERSGAATVFAADRFNLDDFRPLVGEQLRAEGAGQHLGEIDDANTFQGSESRGCHQRSPQWERRFISTVRSPSNTML